MRLKEIKPGMAIHCKNDEEKKALLEEAERLGYLWTSRKNPIDRTFCHGNTIHFYEVNEFADFKHITWSDTTEGAIEFSDLILQEITAEEALKICGEICKEYSNKGYACNSKCPFTGHGMSCIFYRSQNPYKAIEVLEQWKSDHEKKDPEVEEFWEIKCIEDSNFHTSEHYPSEADALVMAKVMAKKDTENTYYAVRVFKAKAVE